MKIVGSLIVCAALAALSSCTTVTADSGSVSKTEPGVPGGEFVRITTLDARVTGIDYAKRDVALVSSHGEAFKVEAGPEVVNFNQIRIGDPLKVSLRQRMLVRMAKPGEQLDDNSYLTGSRAARGAKPGGEVTRTEQYVGTVTAINQKNRKVTLAFSDGSSGSFDVRSDIDLTQRKIGERVLIRSTESLAVSMKKS